MTMMDYNYISIKYVIPVHLFLIMIGKLLALARWPVSHNKNYSTSIDLSDNYI